MKKGLSLLLISLSLGPSASLFARGGGDAAIGGLAGGMMGSMIGTAVTAPRGGGESRSSDSHRTRKLKERIEECEQDISSLEKTVKKLEAKNEALEDRIEVLEKDLKKLSGTIKSADEVKK